MKHPHIQFIYCSEHCPPQLQRAVSNFNSGLNASFTRASKSDKFSIWHYAQMNLGPAFVEILGSERWAVIAPEGFANSARGAPRAMEDKCRLIARLLSRSLAIEYDAKKEEIFYTLEFLVSLIIYCKSIRQRTYTTKTEEADGFLYSRRLKLRTDLPHSPFCELCDQLSEVMEEIRSGRRTKYVERKLASSRFCKIHRPGSSEYRRAHNYREVFHQKIEQLSLALRNGTQTEGIDEVNRLLKKDDTFRKSYVIDLCQHTAATGKSDKRQKGGARSEYRLESYVYGTDEVIRHVAYLLVHPIPSKTRSKTSGRKEEILTFLERAQAQGISISKAARALGISRQAAWKALNG